MNDDQLKLKNVRLSFPDIWEPKAVQGSEPKFGASFLLRKEEDAEQIMAIKRLIWTLAKREFGDKAEGLLEKLTLKKCLHEGSEKDYDGYGEDVMYLSASSKKQPLVIGQAREKLTEADGKPYSGCYVNAIVKLWAQNNSFGKRINAQLNGIQFASHGDPFGEGQVSPEEFELLEIPKGEGEKNDFAPDDDDIPF